MKLTIITTKNNETTTASLTLNAEREIQWVIGAIHSNINRLKKTVIDQAHPYEEIKEQGFGGFISDPLQVIETEDYIDITYGTEHTQYAFAPSDVSAAIAVAA